MLALAVLVLLVSAVAPAHAQVSFDDSRPGFGYMNWSITNDGFMATRSGGHKIKVIPAENLVVVIRVDTYNDGERVGDSTFNQAVELLLQAKE